MLKDLSDRFGKTQNQQDLNELVVSDRYEKINDALEILKKHLRQNSRTAARLLSYLDYIAILKQFILAERASNFVPPFEISI